MREMRYGSKWATRRRGEPMRKRDIVWGVIVIGFILWLLIDTAINGGSEPRDFW